MDAPKLNPKDTLKQSFPKLNQSIDNANEALKKSNTAVTNSNNAVNISNQAKKTAEQVQSEFRQAVLEGDSSPLEGVLSVGADGTVYEDGPQGRLVAEYNKVTGELATMAPRKFIGTGNKPGYAKIGEFIIDEIGHKEFNFEWICGAGIDTSSGKLSGVVQVELMGKPITADKINLTNANFGSSNDINGTNFIIVESLVSVSQHKYELYVILSTDRTFVFVPSLENNYKKSWAMKWAQDGIAPVGTLPTGPKYTGVNSKTTGSVIPELFGANPKATPDKNRESIQKALNIGGDVYLGSSGVYQIDAPLEIGDNTHFKLGIGVVIQLAPGVKSNMLVNKGYKDGTRNKNIKISGGTWDYDEANREYDTENPLNTISIIMKGVDGLSIKEIRGLNAKKYVYLLADINYLSVDDLFFNTHSDGLHLQGPIHKADIRNLKGKTGDDMLAFTIGDFSYYEISRGDFDDINVSGIYPENSLTAVKITGNKPFKFKNISISGIKGSVKNQAVFVMVDENLLQTEVENLVIEDVEIDSSDGITRNVIHIKDSTVKNLKLSKLTHTLSNNSLVYFDGTTIIGRAEIKGIRSEIDFTYRVIRVVSSTNIKSLLIDGVITSLGEGGELLQTEGVIDLITINNADCTLGNGAKVLSHAVNKVSLIQLSNIKWVGGNAVYSQSAATPSGSIVEATNLYGKSTENGFSFRGAGALHLKNVVLDTVLNVPINITDSVAVVDVYGDMQFDDGDDKEHIKYSNGATGIVRGLGLRIDVSTAKKDRTSMCFNRNAALSCGIGPVICNGTTWKNLYTGTTY